MPLKVYSLNSYNNNHSVCFTVSLRDSAPYPQTYSVCLPVNTDIDAKNGLSFEDRMFGN